MLSPNLSLKSGILTKNHWERADYLSLIIGLSGIWIVKHGYNLVFKTQLSELAKGDYSDIKPLNYPAGSHPIMYQHVTTPISGLSKPKEYLCI